MARRAAWGALVLLACGCGGTAFDVEGAARFLRSAEAEKPVILRESPPSELPGPEGVRAVTGELRAVPLKWDPLLLGDVGGYVIERSLREKGDFQRVGTTLDRFVTAFVDRGTDLAPKAAAGGNASDLGDGASYFYRVRAFDGGGRISRAASAIVNASTAPPPSRPEDLRIYSQQPRKIALTWRPASEPTVSGYLVYRSPSESGDYQPVARVDGRYTTAWVDRGLDPLRVFYYRIAAVNEAGGEGIPTAATRGVTKGEPLPPAALRVASEGLGVVKLAWNSNVEPNIAGYRLIRIRDGKEEVVAELASDATSAEDRAVGAGEKLVYRAVAFDDDGLVSAPSDPVETTAPGYGLEARAENDGVRLRWAPEGDADFASARVLREGRFGASEIAQVKGREYLDRDVEPGGKYRYTVVLRDSEGREALPSEPVEVAVPAR